jgi:hypothetical protein
MKNLTVILIVLCTTLFFAGCELVGDIFEAGVWVGVLVVVGIVLLALWLINRIRRS